VGILGKFNVKSCGGIFNRNHWGILFIKITAMFGTGMTWRKAYEYYSERKDETHSPIREDPLFQKFREILEWRMSQGV